MLQDISPLLTRVIIRIKFSIVMKPIILASSSPRRAEILKTMGIPFEIIRPPCEEILPDGLRVEQASEFLAAQKVRSVVPLLSDDAWVLGADTVIILDGKLYGKPKDADDAASFLRDFSGKTHTVYSGIALQSPGNDMLSRTSKTDVTVKELSEREIIWYLSTGEWQGAAGGYRVQGQGACFTTHLSGSPSGVMGLSIFDLYDMLLSLGYFLSK
jgi:septum formation protein